MRTNLRELAVAGLVLAILLAGFWLAGIGPFAPNGGDRSSAGASSISFHQAVVRAVTNATDRLSGPWTPLSGVGAEITEPVPMLDYYGSLAVDLLIPCPLRTLPAPTDWENLTVPASSSSPSVGLSFAWIVALVSPSNGGLLELVFGGTAIPIATFPAPSCVPMSPYDETPLPADAIDSPAAVQAALHGGGAKYLALHPVTNLTMSVDSASIGGGSNGAWTISMTTCPGTAGSGGFGLQGAAFSATLDVSSGTIGPGTKNETGSCEPGGLIVAGPRGTPLPSTAAGTDGARPV